MTRYHRVLATRGGMSYDALSFAELIGDVHWNRFTHQLKTIKGMDWSTKLLHNNYWQLFVHILLPPEISMSGMEQISLMYDDYQFSCVTTHKRISRFSYDSHSTNHATNAKR